MRIRKFLYGLMVVELALSNLGASLPPAVHSPLPGKALRAVPGLSGACLTQTVRITLAAEQVSFCAPTSRPFHVVEDSRSDPNVSYAGLDQTDGYGILNIRATLPGSAPGPGRPVYHPGEGAAYRQAVMDAETARQDRRVSTGPSGIFWNEVVSGMQVDFTLPTSRGDLKVRSIEWYLEHDGRLWSFVISWDTGMQNAGEWEAAAQNVILRSPQGRPQSDTAIDLGASNLEDPAGRGISPKGAPVDVGTPSWWIGVCNDSNFYPATGVHSYPLGATWHGVPACGPLHSTHLVRFFSGAWGEFEFQCVELVMRFLYQEWEIAPWGGTGRTIKDSPPGSIVFYPNDGAHAIVPGDILTEDGTVSNSSGHAVIITAVSLNGSRSGTASILEQNSSSGGSRSLSVVKGIISPDAWTWGSPVQGWLHVKGNQDGDGLKYFLPLIISR